MKSLKGFELPL